jgi:hypothetical protein
MTLRKTVIPSLSIAGLALAVASPAEVRAQSAEATPAAASAEEVAPANADAPAVAVASAETAAPSDSRPPAPVLLAAAAAPAVDVSATAPAPQAESASPSLVEAIVRGKVGADLRYRFEYIDQDGLYQRARASTLRAALGYETDPFWGFSVMGQFAGVTNVGPDDYRIPTSPSQNKMERPVILDPIGNQVSQAYLKYANPWLLVRVGRQEMALNNARFLSFSGWRQVHQSLDAAHVSLGPWVGAGLSYTFIGRVNRVVGNEATDGQLDMASHLINLTYKLAGKLSAALYGVLLDFDDAPTNSTNSFGARLEGPFALGESWGVLYAAEFAHQRNAGQNPNEVRANYYLLEGGVGYKSFGLRLQYNVREGESATNKFSTPLSHPWDGWTEKFFAAPDNGLRTLSASVGGPLPWVAGLNLVTAYYEYWGQSGGGHYGREFDAGIEYRLVPLDKNWAVGTRFAYYKADNLFTDTLRTSVYTAYAF